MMMTVPDFPRLSLCCRSCTMNDQLATAAFLCHGYNSHAWILHAYWCGFYSYMSHPSEMPLDWCEFRHQTKCQAGLNHYACAVCGCENDNVVSKYQATGGGDYYLEKSCEHVDNLHKCSGINCQETLRYLLLGSMWEKSILEVAQMDSHAISTATFRSMHEIIQSFGQFHPNASQCVCIFPR